MVKIKDFRNEYDYKKVNKIDVDLLIMHIFGLTKNDIILGDKEIDEKNPIFIDGLKRLENDEPISYITGTREFMGLDFSVNSSTLIPRPDTEILVEAVLNLTDGKTAKILDIGCGSGCIGISLAYYNKNAHITEIDISENALDTAKENAIKNGVNDRISFINMDILSDFPTEEFDILVSNPPYIRSNVVPTLEKNVRDFEPLTALDGGDDGLIFYKRIIENEKIKKNGYIAFEIGYDQGTEVSNLLEKCGKFGEITLLKDLAGNDRVVIAEKL